jgi:hypothetical protein
VCVFDSSGYAKFLDDDGFDGLSHGFLLGVYCTVLLMSFV